MSQFILSYEEMTPPVGYISNLCLWWNETGLFRGSLGFDKCLFMQVGKFKMMFHYISHHHFN